MVRCAITSIAILAFGLQAGATNTADNSAQVAGVSQLRLPGQDIEQPEAPGFDAFPFRPPVTSGQGPGDDSSPSLAEVDPDAGTASGDESGSVAATRSDEAGASPRAAEQVATSTTLSPFAPIDNSTTATPGTQAPVRTPPATSSTVPTPTTAPPATTAAPPVPTTTPAPPTTTAPLTGPEAVGQQILAELGWDWRSELPGWSMVFLPSTPGYLGGTWPERREIEIYVRDDQSYEHVRHIVGHELGHALDVSRLDDFARLRWRNERGLPADSVWWGRSGESDFATPSGDFAEAFAAWLTGPGHFRSEIGGEPDQGDLDLIAEFAR